jgi:hypothetical protein
MTRVRKRPRGFYARLARARGVSVNAVYRKLNPDKRPCAREKHECDASPPWDPRGSFAWIKPSALPCGARSRAVPSGRAGR